MKKLLITTLLASTLTAGVLNSTTFNGSQSLRDTEALATTFKATALDYISKAQELEQLAQDQNTDITLLMAKISELKGIREELTAQIDTLSIELEGAEGENTALTAEIERLTGELEKANTEIEKANTEIEKANTEVEAHKQAMTALLDSSIFTSIEVPERIDISGALEDTEAEPEADALNIEVEYKLQNSSPNRAGAEEYYNSTVKDLVNTIDFTEEQKATISLVKVTITDSIENNSKFKASIEFNCTDRDSIYTAISNKLVTFNDTNYSIGVSATVKQI